jgi:hypothetical protein
MGEEMGKFLSASNVIPKASYGAKEIGQEAQ